MGFLDFSYIKTIGVKWPGHKKRFCVFSDTLLCNTKELYVSAHNAMNNTVDIIHLSFLQLKTAYVVSGTFLCNGRRIG